MKIKIGAHVSFSKANGYLPGAVEESLSWGANSMMIYMGPPQSAKRIDTSNYNLKEYLDKYKDKIISKDIIVHAPYIINPANKEKEEFNISFLSSELKRSEYIGAEFIVLHPGAAGKSEVSDAIKQCAKVINESLAKTDFIRISIETMAGKGTEIGRTFEELAQIIELVEDKDRIGVCLDTCHAWDAGYDITDFEKVLDEFDKVIGLDKLDLIHLNDSKNPINSHKDRHENIGKGHIGFEALKRVLYSKRCENIVKILETPYVDGKPIYKEEIYALTKSF